MKLGILGTGMIVKDLLTTIHELKIESIYILGTQQTEEETKSLCEQYHLDGYDLNYDDLILFMSLYLITYIIHLLKKH